MASSRPTALRRGRSRSPYAPRRRRARRTPRVDVRDRQRTASFAAAASAGASSRQPRKFGCWKKTAATSAAQRRAPRDPSRRRGRRPPRPRSPRQLRTSSRPALTCRLERLGENDLLPIGHVAATKHAITPRPSSRRSRMRSTRPSPVSSQITVWYSKIACSVPWLISRLVRGVRGQELAAREDDVGDRRHVVVVDPRTDERELRARVRSSRRAPPGVARARPRRAPVLGSRSKRTPGGICSNSSSR